MLHLTSEDLLYVMLSKLPVKSLLRLRCVSKSWLNLIGSSYFINMHLNHTKNNSSNTMFIPLDNTMFIPFDDFSNPDQTIPMYALDFNNQDKSKYEARKIEPPVNYNMRNVHTCNGLICLLSNKDTLIIWNPATHKRIEVRRLKTEECLYYLYFGFGYDHKTDNYKVVMLEKYKEEKCFIVHVYSLKTGLWRRLGKTNEIRGILYWSVYASGAIHWVDHDYFVTEESLETKLRIVAFDLTTEKWLPQTMPPEQRTGPAYLQTWALSNHQESLCASCHDDETNLVDLWVMKYEGIKCIWSKLVTVKGINDDYLPTTITPVWSLKKTSRQQLLLNNDTKMELYDIEKGTREDFHVSGVSKVYKSFICYESLVPV